MTQTSSLPTTPQPSVSEDGTFECFGVTLFTANHPHIKSIKKQGYAPSIHGTKCWNSAFVMMDYFNDCPPEYGLRVLDLGCGWGPLGIYLAKHHGAQVVGMDADSDVFPFLQLQAQANDVELLFMESRFEDVPAEEMDAYDLIIGTDICFWDALVSPLMSLITTAHDVACPTVMIADPGRSPFYALHSQCAEAFGAQCELQEWFTQKPNTQSSAQYHKQNKPSTSDAKSSASSNSSDKSGSSEPDETIISADIIVVSAD